MKLYNITKSLILEVASIESVIDAIRNKDTLIIYYDGDLYILSFWFFLIDKSRLE